ncbi:FAD-binding oxidoreductase [Methylosinus sp. Ce-a6]|uniref:NAD(P)/FAD-dependent oxidoreductase n=1 Tax=Methylosinus sp. Ce-a6 TaxID=2172005 RepID=UPI0013580AA9|nr:FAD-dependent oxidoreductase [Methylosinus sp. Ce-a6]
MQQTADVAVLGAGMVGVSAALHLQARGRDVALVDRHGAAGLETSFGNAGLIERASIFPYLFPRDPRDLLYYALNLSPQAHYHLSALPGVASWLLRYFRESGPERAKSHALAALPLVERCLEEHDALIEVAGAGELVRRIGWIKLYRSESRLAKGLADAERLREFKLRIEVLDADALAALEPDLARVAGAVHFLDTCSVADPSAVAQSYAALFQQRGGRFLAGDVRGLQQTRDGRWSVPTHDGQVIARDLVVALGPWSDQIFRPLGYDLPFAVKRGYHMHYAVAEGAKLSHPVLDADNGYVLAPMTRGVRLTTGAEFARRDAKPTPVQIDWDEKLARTLFPIRERLDPKPWMGCRPCFPDMLPVIGKAPRHQGLWFDFGHQHHGFTLGPVSGRLLAEMMTGAEPFTDPAPYAVDRFR